MMMWLWKTTDFEYLNNESTKGVWRRSMLQQSKHYIVFILKAEASCKWKLQSCELINEPYLFRIEVFSTVKVTDMGHVRSRGSLWGEEARAMNKGDWFPWW